MAKPKVKRDKHPDGDVVIAVIGRTGCGKSNFIQVATGHEEGVGHGLQRCTTEITPVQVGFAQHIVLVDTPGFDDVDDSGSDQVILSKLLEWLQKTYEKNFHLAGILYLHRIDDNHPPRLSILRSLDKFDKLCGDGSFQKIIFTTTMWQNVEQSIGIKQEEDFRNEYWMTMVKGGSQTMRFENTAKSAWRILNRIIDLKRQPDAGQIPRYASSLGKGVSVTEDRCRSLILNMIHIRDQRIPIEDLRNSDARLMADYLNTLLHGNLSDEDCERLLSIVVKLAKYGHVHPRCYELGALKYDPTARVARGAFGDIYKGTHGNQTICVKVVMIPSGAEGENMMTELMKIHFKELMLWAHLSHRNILPFYGVYKIPNSSNLCLVSPWMENGDLHKYAKGVPQSERKVWLSDIIDGLSYLHGKKIVHGDLKAANILISDDKRALIADFGMSYVTMATARMTSSGTGYGTARWAAPELLGDGIVRPTQESDIWSFGCICYEILASKVPFYTYEKDHQVIAALQKGNIFPKRPEPNSEDAIDDDLWAMMMSCWNYTPGPRATCAGVRDGLTRLGICRSDDTPEAAAGSNHAFWEAVREKSNIEVDYDAVEKILLGIRESTRI